jgi:DNA-binding protein YbaB
MFDKMKELFALQGKLTELKRELAASYLDLEWFSGKLKLRINGSQEIKDIYIDPGFLKSQVDIASKLSFCFNEAIRKSQALAAEKTKQIVGINIPGL